MIRKSTCALTAVFTLAVATPASAATQVLTFDDSSQPGAVPACTTTDGGLTNKTCNHVDFIGVDYGTTPQLAVSYDAAGSPVSLRHYGVAGGFYPGGGAFNFLGDTNVFSNIVLTPTAGNEVSLLSWLYTNGSATAVNYFFEVRDASNNLVASHTANTGGMYIANTPYFSGPLTFRFRNESGGAIIDNIAFDVRGIAQPPGGVPEPASWAMMLAGFGLAGGAMRRRQRSGARVLA